MSRNPLIVFDLEATCWADADPLHALQNEISETIEIGAAFLEYRQDSGWDVTSTFDVLIRPKNNPTLSEFCKSLTGITQEDVDQAPYYPEAWTSFLGWAKDKSASLAAWGPADKRWLDRDCENLSLENPWAESEGVDVKEIFMRQMSRLGTTYKRVGLQKALKKAGLEFQGRPHRGVDDARMTALLAAWLFDPLNYTQPLQRLHGGYLKEGPLTRDDALRLLRWNEELLSEVLSEAKDLRVFSFGGDFGELRPWDSRSC